MATTVAAKSVLLRLMSASVEVANHAGKIIREIMRKGDLGIVEKGINDFSTEADRSAQRCIVNSLSKYFPKVTIIAEEELEKLENDDDFLVNLNDCETVNAKCPEILQTVKEEDVVIWVDPLDGTAEYADGLLDHVTVLIGVAINGKAVGGVIHQPYYNYKPTPYSEIYDDYSKLGRTMWGIVGFGAYGIECRSPPEGKRIITTTRSHCNPIINATMAALNPDEILRVGGAGHKVLLLIEGEAHAYVYPRLGTKKWDTCAPEALLHAVGGKLTDMHGNSLRYDSKVNHVNDQGVLATYAASAHNWYCVNIPKDILESLSAKI